MKASINDCVLFAETSRVVPRMQEEDRDRGLVSEQQVANDGSFLAPSGNGDNAEKERLKVIEEAYRPLLIIMMLFGSYFGHTSFDNLHETTQSRPQRHCRSVRFYCFAVVCSLWISFVMSVVSILYGSEIYFLIMFISWTLMVALMGTTCLIVFPLTSTRKSRFEQFLRRAVTINIESDKLKNVAVKAKMYVNIFSFVSLSAIAAEIMSDVFLGINVVMFEPWKRWQGFRIIFLTLLAYGVGVWFVFPFFFITCTLIEALFDDLNKRMLSSHSNSSLNVTNLRKEHLALCEIVEMADNVFSALLFEAVGFYIPVICFTFYQMAHADLSEPLVLADIAINLFWLTMSLAILAAIMTSGSRVNEKVRLKKPNLLATEVFCPCYCFVRAIFEF